LTQHDKTSNKCLDNESYLRSQIISGEYLTNSFWRKCKGKR
jgi:hypothetical protein